MAIVGKITKDGFVGNLQGTASFAEHLVNSGSLFENMSADGATVKVKIAGVEKSASIIGVAPASHSHSFSDIESLPASASKWDGAAVSASSDASLVFNPADGLVLNLTASFAGKVASTSFNAAHNHDNQYAAKSYEGKVDTLIATTASYATDVNAQRYAADAVISGSNAAAAAESASKAYTDEEIAKIPAATVTGVKSGEKVIGLNNKELTSTLTINYDSTSRKVQLKGISGALVSEFDASAFVKDGILYDQVVAVATGTSMEVTFPKGDKNTFTGLTNKHTYIFLEFNDGLGTEESKTFDKLDTTGLVDVYTSGNGIDITNNVVKAVAKINDSYIEVTADGIASKGIDTAIANAKAAAEATASVDATTKANAAEQNAKDYADDLFGTAVTAVAVSNASVTYTVDGTTEMAGTVDNVEHATQATEIISGSVSITVVNNEIVFTVPN